MTTENGITRPSRFIRDQVGQRDWVDFVKGVAIIMVVVYHTTLFLNSIDFNAVGAGRAKNALELFPMPVFFFIAGLYALRVQSWTLKETWHRKLSGYLYLYILWSVIRFIFYVVVPNVRSDGAGVSAQDPIALLEILFWPTSSYWFIYALFVFTFVTWLIRKLPLWVQIGVPVLLSIIFSASVVSSHNVGWDKMGEYFFFFIVGTLFSKRIFARVKSLVNWQVMVLVGLAVVTAAVFLLAPRLGRLPGIAFVGECAMVAFGIALATRLVKYRALTIFSYLGARSFNIYLFHIFIIAGLTVAVRAFPELHLLPNRGLIMLGVVSIVVLVASVFLGRLLTRFPWLFVSPLRRKPAKQAAARRSTFVDAKKVPTRSNTKEP